MGYLASQRGDYLGGYRGDPGLFGSIGRALGGVAKTVGRFVPGPAGGILTTVGGALAPSRPAPTTVAPPMRPTFTGMRVGGPYGIEVGRKTGYYASGQLPVPVTAAGGVGCPKGYRLNMSSYFLRDGTFVPEGSKCVRYRYRNVANGRALKRAIARTKAFDKLVKDNRKTLRSLSSI